MIVFRAPTAGSRTLGVVALSLLAVALLLACAAYVVARPAVTSPTVPRFEMSSVGRALNRAVPALPGSRSTLAERWAVHSPSQHGVAEGDLDQAVSQESLPLAPSPNSSTSEPSSETWAEAAPDPVPPGPAPTPAPSLAPAEPVSAPAPAPAEPLIDASFESGLHGWNTAGVGEVLPRLTTDIVRDGEKAVAVRLTGESGRSELILGGNGGSSTDGMAEFREGDEYWYGFSFYIESMVYGGPGAHNLIMQFKSDGEGSPNFGLQLWDYAGDDGHSGGRGLWSHGSAMGGDRFLAPVPEEVWHDVAIHFRASSVEAGFYEVYLNGQLVDTRSGVSMIVPGRSYAYVKDGLYRNGSEAPGTSEVRLDAAKLGETLQSVSVQP